VGETVYQPPEYTGEAGLITAGITLARRMYRVAGTGNQQVSRVYHMSFARQCCGMLAVLSLEIASPRPWCTSASGQPQTRPGGSCARQVHCNPTSPRRIPPHFLVHIKHFFLATSLPFNIAQRIAMRFDDRACIPASFFRISDTRASTRQQSQMLRLRRTPVASRNRELIRSGKLYGEGAVSCWYR
jgi:hypothetical protein